MEACRNACVLVKMSRRDALAATGVAGQPQLAFGCTVGWLGVRLPILAQPISSPQAKAATNASVPRTSQRERNIEELLLHWPDLAAADRLLREVRDQLAERLGRVVEG